MEEEIAIPISRVRKLIKEAVETRESEIAGAALSLPASFWEDSDHAVGGYISKKDLKSFLSSLMLEKITN